MEGAIQFAVARGALTSCNHPKPFGPEWEYEETEGCHCVEVWNGPWYVLNQMSLDFWLKQLAAGKRLVAVGGSDYHHRGELEQTPPRAPGTPTVWVHVTETPSARAILQAIRQGHVALSDEPDGPLLDLRAGTGLGGDVLPRPASSRLAVHVRCERGAGNQLSLLNQHGILFEQNISSADEEVAVELEVGDSLYVRAELRDSQDTMRALTNPIYLTDV
jgi:hypothetical protein